MSTPSSVSALLGAAMTLRIMFRSAALQRLTLPYETVPHSAVTITVSAILYVTTADMREVAAGNLIAPLSLRMSACGSAAQCIMLQHISAHR